LFISVHLLSVKQPREKRGRRRRGETGREREREREREMGGERDIG